MLPYGAHVGARIAKLKGSRPGCDAKPVNPRKGIDEFVSQSVTQVVLVAAGTHVGERENCDGRDVVYRRIVSWSGFGRNIRELSHELVSATMARFNEARLLRVIFQHLAELLNAGS